MGKAKSQWVDVIPRQPKPSLDSEHHSLAMKNDSCEDCLASLSPSFAGPGSGRFEGHP